MPSDADLELVRRACTDLLALTKGGHVEIWVKLLVQDLLAFVAKQPSIAHVLLEDNLYGSVSKLSRSKLGGLASSKLEKRLAKIHAEDEITASIRTVSPLIGEKKISEEQAEVVRKVCNRLLRILA